MATSKIDGAHGIPRDIETFTNTIQQLLHDIGKKIIGNGIKPQPTKRHACRLIQHVNRKEEESEGHK